MRGAGQRDKLVTLRRFTAMEDSHGEEVQAWEDIAQEYASILFGRGSERREAAQTQASQSATFQMLENGMTRGLTAKDRIAWNGIEWELAAPGVPVNRGELEFTAMAAVR